jgi:hypothetical protein
MEHSIERLSSFLREEISAVEVYQHVLSRVKSEQARQGLHACYQDHVGRVETIKEFIGAHGETPKEVPSHRGFGRIPGVAESLQDRSMVEILQEGEEFESQDYENLLIGLDAEDRRFVEERVLPNQRATRERLRSLREALH